MLIKKADVKKHFAAKARKHHTPSAVASAATSNSFTLFGSSIKPVASPAPTVDVAAIPTPEDRG
jgi:hypothetical protein